MNQSNRQGFEEETPYIRIGNSTLKGTKVNTVGTDLIFEVDESKTTLNGREFILSSQPLIR